MPEINPWISLLGTLGGIVIAIASLITARASRQKGSGDFVNAIAEAAAKVVTTLRNENAELSQRVERLEVTVRSHEKTIETLHKENRWLRDRLTVFENGIVLLVSQIKSLGHTPYWTPPPAETEGKQPTT